MTSSTLIPRGQSCTPSFFAAILSITSWAKSLHVSLLAGGARLECASGSACSAHPESCSYVATARCQTGAVVTKLKICFERPSVNCSSSWRRAIHAFIAAMYEPSLTDGAPTRAGLSGPVSFSRASQSGFHTSSSAASFRQRAHVRMAAPSDGWRRWPLRESCERCLKIFTSMSRGSASMVVGAVAISWSAIALRGVYGSTGERGELQRSSADRSAGACFFDTD